MILPPDIAQELADDALSIGTDEGGGAHYRLTYSPPQPVLADLRFAGKTERTTIWHSPRYRAILLASQGAGELVMYQTQATYDLALQAARQGICPTLDRQR